MHKIKYKEMAVNRPVIIQHGFPGEIECNTIQTYLGEWVVFKLAMNDEQTVWGELRLPVDEALDQGLVVSSDKIYSPDEEEEQDIGG